MPSYRGQLPGALIAAALLCGAARAEMVEIPYDVWARGLMRVAEAATGYSDADPQNRIAAIKAAGIVFYVGPCRGRITDLQFPVLAWAKAVMAVDRPGDFNRASLAVLGLLTSQGMGRGDKYTCRFAEELMAIR